MGLFQGRQIYTSSAAFNLAGDVKRRPDFLKSVIFGHIGNPDKKKGFGKYLSDLYLAGPGTKMRGFHRWALNNYSAIGTPGEVKLNIDMVLTNTVGQELELMLGKEITLQGVEIKGVDYGYWAEQYMLEFHSSTVMDVWHADINDLTNEITITQGTSTYTFMPADYDPDATYLYAAFREETVGEGQPKKVSIYIYRVGSGGNPTIDALVADTTEQDALFPVIPVRLADQFISETHKPDAYALAKKAYKKATGGKFSDIVTALEENPDLGQIDYAYVQFGAALNSETPAAKRYIFDFLEEQKDSLENEAHAEFETWKAYATEAYSKQTLWYEHETLDDPNATPPADPQPEHIASPSPPRRSIQIKCPGTIDINFDVRIEWNSITKTTHAGLGKPDAKVGDVWFEADTGYLYNNLIYGEGINTNEQRSVNKIYAYKQVSASEHHKLSIYGLVQKTYVFGDHYEELLAVDAMFGTDAGQETSFIIPLRISTLKNMPMVEATELCCSCAYLTIHAYEIVVPSGFVLQIWIMIAVILVSAGSGAFAAGSTGILGTNAAVGAALGVTGTAAAMVGAIANMLAAMLVTRIITAASKEVFGDELGAIIGAVASFAAMNGLTNLAANGSFSLNFGNLLQATNLMQMTNALVSGYTGYVAAQTQGYIEDTQKLLEDYEAKSEEIQELYEQAFGYGNGIVDPYSLVDNNQILVEAPSSFLTRTLMTGSDIAELSLDMLSNFPELTLSNNLPLQ